MVLIAVLLCVNSISCSKDESPTNSTEEPNRDENIISEKKITKINISNGDESEVYTFSYDDKGRVINGEHKDKYGTYSYNFVWGDDAIKTSWTSSGSENNYSCMLSLKNGLVQHEDYRDEDKGTFTYNASNKLVKFSDGEYWTVSAIWDDDKLVSVSKEDSDATLTYNNIICKNGYFPLIATIIGAGESEPLYLAHPEIVGMRTSQLPSSITWKDYYESETGILTYEFNNDGYISKITIKEDSNTSTYTLTWE